MCAAIFYLVGWLGWLVGWLCPPPLSPSQVGLSGTQSTRGVGSLARLEGRGLDNFVFQRTCLLELGLEHLDPKAQVLALTKVANSSTSSNDSSTGNGSIGASTALVPPWQR